MDGNYIKKDGFSNPETERFFKRFWRPEQLRAVCEALEHCGVCRASCALVDSPQSNLWVLCLEQESPHYLETVHFGFSCPRQTRSQSQQLIPCPWDPEPETLEE